MPVDSTTGEASGFPLRAKNIAEEEWRFFGGQLGDLAGAILHPGHRQDEDGWWQRVGLYWRALDPHLGGLDGRILDGPQSHWSAAFISYVIRQAGPGEGFFPYSARHSTYISKSILDRKSGNQNTAYWGYALNERSPGIGDLLCWSREPVEVVDLDHQWEGKYNGHTDLVVAVSQGEIETISGNTGLCITRRKIPLGTNGFLVPLTAGGGTDDEEKLFALMGCRL